MARTATKRPAPKAKLADPRNEALQRMTKAELVKTVKTLDRRVTQLLNERDKARELAIGYARDCHVALSFDRKPRMPDSSEPVAANFADQEPWHGEDKAGVRFPWQAE